ncbi:PC4 and SFRS1-interacting protein-like isoform X4 [Prorops nasuta]|uniref:PC4 and SFRS1-interacting protein-like isoform X4 n=1 Tax=Prorops nasuta TaxID=863751 RepID=UPI0034CDF1BB
MVKLLKKFFAGDKVFAKVRGYPPWPAKIEKVIDPNSKNARYCVYFYGTGETAVCKVEELFTYAENKEKFGKPLRRKFFHEGLQQLEQELKADEEQKDIDDAAELPMASAADSDLEKCLESPEMKRKRGKAKSLSSFSGDIMKQDTGIDSQGEESPKEVVSRSGRKIKRKRFADFSSSEETEEHLGRGRGKIKVEDSSEQTSPTLIHKKRAALEKRNNIDETQLLEGAVVSTSTDTTGRFLLARTFAGEYVGIKLDLDRPKSFETDKARAQWDWSTARNAMKLKAQLESGEILPEQIKEQLDFNVHVPEEEKKILVKDSEIQQKKFKLRWLRIEEQLLELDASIKSNLGLDQANADKCLQFMDGMLSLSVDPLMLKKHPHIVETVKRLRRYIGNLADWKLSEEEVVTFKQKAEQIRQKAEHIYNKFKAMFTIPEGQSFWQIFSDQVVHFKQLTKDMSEEKVFSLMSDPARVETSTPSYDNASQPDSSGMIEEGEEAFTGSEIVKGLEAK